METYPQSVASAMPLSTQTIIFLAIPLFSDLVPNWSGLHHWPEENGSLLFPEAKA